MVTSINKWLSVSAFILLAGFIKNPIQITRHHPFHVSTTEINHNTSDKTLEISCKVFTDDFESALTKQYHTKADLSAVKSGFCFAKSHLPAAKTDFQAAKFGFSAAKRELRIAKLVGSYHLTK